MRVRFEFRRYRLPFRTPVRTAHGSWSVREGVLVRLTAGSDAGAGGSGYGEAAPIPWFGTEAVEEVEAECRALGEWVDDRRLNEVPPHFRCLRNAIASARSELGETRAEPAAKGGPAGPGYLPCAALLPAGRRALAEIGTKAEAGFRVFKWKVGVGDVADELGLFDDLCGELPPGGRLRLDANGAWNRAQAERWLERCAERPVEFVEQPCLASSKADGAERRRVEDLLLGLAGDFPTPIGLDEALITESDVERWMAAGWPGIFVVKPSLIGDPATVLAKLANARAAVVLSAALETAVGARAGLRMAFAWPGEPRALGFGVWPLFSDPRCDGPAAAPFIRYEDVGQLNPEAVWNAVS